jgi:Tol biopolymer transport system component
MLQRVRSLRVIALLWPAALSSAACFGKVEYDELPSAGGAPGGGVGGQGELPGQHPAPSGGSLGTGGGGSTGGSMEVPATPNCGVDCCPTALAQLTRSLDGGALDQSAERPYLSADGAWVVFSSRATNLTDGKASGYREVFVRSLVGGTVLPVRPAGGEPPSGDSEAIGISADGRWVLLTSSATNLAPDDENGVSDAFLFDRVTLAFTLISRAPSGAAGNGSSLARDLSADGRYVVYSSSASNLTAGDDNGAWDVFVWDRSSGSSERISMGPGDQQRNPVGGNHAHISADGRYVSFHSQSDLLVPGDSDGTFDIFLSDRHEQTTVKVSRSISGGPADGNAFVLGMSEDARYLSAYASATNLVPADTNGQTDVFLFDRALAKTTRVNLGPAGEEADVGSSSVALSPDGRFLGFASAAKQLSPALDGMTQQSYLYDVKEGRVQRLSESSLRVPGDADSQVAELSGSGRCFVFSSWATNLTSDSTADDVMDVFVGSLPGGGTPGVDP